MIDDAETVAAYKAAAVPALDMVGLVENGRFLVVEKPAFLRDWKMMRMNGRMGIFGRVGQDLNKRIP